MPNPFRNLPSVSQLLESPPLKKLVDSVNHQVVVDGVRNFLDEFRARVSSTAEDVNIPGPKELAERIASWLQDEDRPYLRPVINGTGIILHTGLGRAPIAKSALAAVSEISSGYASVEVDLSNGERGQRVRSVERLLCELTGAEAAVVVNNNAAATMITLAAMATGKEVIVSRGQMIEIGGSFRLPQVMECSHAKLREVGTTNKTHEYDYEDAICEETGALLRVHPSNFEIVGFTKSVSTKEMVKIGAKHGVPVIDDVGSGALVDFADYGLRDEPLVRDSVRAGADVVLFSGDKLVGGPQCGIIVGKSKSIKKIMKHPLMRAMRVGKMTLAALAATLRLYRNVEKAEMEVPLLRMLSTSQENLRLRAEKIVGQIAHYSFLESCEAIEDEAMLGGGSLPTQKVPSWSVSMKPANETLDRFAKRLRDGSPAVMGRIQKDRFVLDMRSISPNLDVDLAARFEALESYE